jgi:hypothetical protein
MTAPRTRTLWAVVATLRVVTAPLVTAALVAASSAAWAGPTDQDGALALKLFDDGRALFAAGKVAAACDKFEESRRLDPLPGTILNLAVCHEQCGRTASAVAEFRQARALAERDRRDDRIALIDQHLHAIEGKVSSIVIVVGPDADRAGLSVSRDGTAVGRTVWGSRIPMDPGEHVVEASAPDKKPWKATVKVLPDGDVQTVTLSPLEDAAPAPVSVAPPAVEPPPPQPPAPVVPMPGHHGTSTRKTVGLATGAAGIGGVAIGTYFGLLAIQTHGKSAATCTTTPCSPQSVSLNGQAGTQADISTVAFAAGLAALGVGAFLWLGDSGGRGDKPSASVAPSFGPGRGGLDVVGSF